MRWLRALALLLFLGGCTYVLPPSEQVLPTAVEVAVAVAPLPEPPVAALEPTVEAVAPAVVGSEPAAAAVDEAASEQGDDTLLSEATAEEQLVADAETEEDNLLLTDPDLTAPADEGVSLPPAVVTFDFPVVENQKVRYFIDYYTGPGRKVFGRWLERSGRYLPMMQDIFQEHGLPLDLTYLAMVESGFNPRAYSWAHASGPWQFMAGTGRMFGLTDDWWRDERRDFEKSTVAAARFLLDLRDAFDGDWNLAVASYNAGPGKMKRAIQKYKSRDFWEISRGKYLQEETKNYLPKLMAVLLIAKEPQKYGFAELEYVEPVAYDTVTIPTVTDLEVVARLCQVDYEAVKELNPELKRWCTPPDVKNYSLRIPQGHKEQFLASYAALPVTDRANYLHHRVKSGDTLLALAQRYKIRVADIVDLNKIRNPRALKVGADLILPLKKGGKHPLVVRELRDDYARTRRQTYTVRAGDSLWKISQRFDVSEKQLRVWNNLGWSKLIRPGQVLAVSATGTKAVKKVAAAKTAGDKGTRIVYQVRAGDTLSKIARRYDVSIARIVDWNNLSQDHILQPGDRLTLVVADVKRS